MKKIYTLFVSLLFGAALFAADARPVVSKLTIRSQDNDDIKVMIDGKRFDPSYNSLMLENLKPGSHKIKVYKEKDRLFNIFGTKKYELVYNASIVVKPRTHTLITIDRFNRSKVDVQTLYNYGNGKGNNGRGSRDWDERDHHYDFDRDGRPGSQDGDWYDDDDFRGNDRYARAMSDYEFTHAMAAINREWLESDKLKKAEQVVDANFFTSSQVKQMVQYFSFETNKLELAKYAFRKTIDPQNYYMVEDALSLNKSKKELQDFTRVRRR